MKETAQRIFRSTLAAIDIPETLARKMDRRGSRIRAEKAIIDLSGYREIVAVAFGKAAFAMAEGLARILTPEYQIDGILVVPAALKRDVPGWTTFVGGHPAPNDQSFEAGKAILSRLARCDDRSLIFFLISGGGSALVEQALDRASTIEDFQKLNSALVTCGAPIEEINVIRKHLSAIKGGRLAAAAPHSMKVTFAISDVPLGQESALASGPTIPDPSTVADAEKIAGEYDLLEKFPSSIKRIFEQHQLRETPKPGDPAFERSHFDLLLGEHELFHAAHHTCEAAGYVCVCDWAADNSPVDKAADHLLALLEAHKRANPGHKVAVLADGEVISPVTGKGVGGRNLAFVLACVPKIAGKKITVLSAGTDGIDGNSPAAGAVADGESLARGSAAGLDHGDFLRRSDAYTYFARIGDAIVTGATGNNLRDLRILLTE
ncbi:MAG: glycerate kinase type-2 family protein [Candidatus Acidiferrales bacterium]